MSIMPMLHLLHGIPGSGKTTFSLQVERQYNAVRFAPDEWMVALHGANPPVAIFHAQHERIMSLIWEHAGKVLRAGRDVVLEGGFWSRISRNEARFRAAEFGVPCRLYSLHCSGAEARRRVLARTAALPPGTLEISGATFDILLRQLEPLGPDEDRVVVPSESAQEINS